MKIKFSKDIELDDWYSYENRIGNDQFHKNPVEKTWIRRFVENANNNRDMTIMVSIKRDTRYKDCYVNFFDELKFLHKFLPFDGFPPDIDGDLEKAKQYVDDFLIRMSKINAFT